MHCVLCSTLDIDRSGTTLHSRQCFVREPQLVSNAVLHGKRKASDLHIDSGRDRKKFRERDDSETVDEDEGLWSVCPCSVVDLAQVRATNPRSRMSPHPLPCLRSDFKALSLCFTNRYTSIEMGACSIIRSRKPKLQTTTTSSSDPWI